MNCPVYVSELNMLSEDLSHLPRYAYGDSPAMADEILALVLSGKMTASCMALRNVGIRAPMPEVGAHAVVLNGAGRPAALIETSDVRVGPISSVSLEFVIAEGEGYTAGDGRRVRAVPVGHATVRRSRCDARPTGGNGRAA